VLKLIVDTDISISVFSDYKLSRQIDFVKWLITWDDVRACILLGL